MGFDRAHEDGRLQSKPRPRPDAGDAASSDRGTMKLVRLDAGGLLLSPSGRGPVPVLVMLHGAGGSAEDSIALVRKAAEHSRIAVVAPKSQGMTWDAIRNGFGQDVQAIDRALAHIFERYDVRTEKVAIAGFSDGGTYALTLGLSNGDLFHEILAFSPGFIASGRMNGRPRVYISHGRSDKVLPFERTGARLAAQLTTAGYETRFDAFVGGHTVPSENVTAAFEWWLGS